MLYCVYHLFKEIVEECQKQIGFLRDNSTQLPLELPDFTPGYKVLIQEEGNEQCYKIEIRTWNGKIFGVIFWNRAMEEMYYSIFDVKGRQVEEGAFLLSTKPTEEEMVDLTEEDYEYTFSISSADTYADLPLTTLILELDGSDSAKWDQDEIHSLDFQFLPALREIIIKDNSFTSVKSLNFSSLNYLESIIIGRNCFTSTPNAISSTTGRLFHVCECPALQSITVGAYSLSECNNFKLENTPQLTSISFDSFAFFNSPVFNISSKSNIFVLFTKQHRYATIEINYFGQLLLLQRRDCSTPKSLLSFPFTS